MASVLEMSGHFFLPLEDVVVWADEDGRPRYGSVETFLESPKRPFAPGMDAELAATIEAAKSHADRHGFPIVSVIRF